MDEGGAPREPEAGMPEPDEPEAAMPKADEPEAGTPDTDTPEAGEPDADPGTYIGRLPEHAADTIPGGLTRKDERVSAVDTQTGAKSPEPETPEGHREGEQASDDTIREAGQNE
jgi:hypothetical protein